MQQFISTRGMLAAAVLAISSASAMAATNPFTETFNTNASNWLNVDSGPATYFATGGVDDSGYISFTSTFTSDAVGPGPGAPTLKLLMRGTNSANSSGDAFVGDWLTAGVDTFSVAVRHNNASALDFYTRLAGNGGAGASVATGYSVAPNTWTTITLPITNSNPPFLSFGSSSFTGVFTNIQSVTLGLYVPANTTFTNLKFDVDNVSIVPEPASLAAIGLGAAGLLRRKRRA